MKANVFYVASLGMLSAAWLCTMPVLAAETETEASAAFPVTVVDAYDNEVTLDAAPTSIVSLAPTDTEILGMRSEQGGHDRKTDYRTIRRRRPVSIPSVLIRSRIWS